MNYIDGYVLAVPTANRTAYLEMANMAAAIFKEYGALRVVECWGDDVPPGRLTSFPMAVKCEAEETVVFSWVEWPCRCAMKARKNSWLIRAYADAMRYTTLSA